MMQRLFDEEQPYQKQKETIKRKVVAFTLSQDAGRQLARKWMLLGQLPQDFDGKALAVVKNQEESLLGWYDINEFFKYIDENR